MHEWFARLLTLFMSTSSVLGEEPQVLFRWVYKTLGEEGTLAVNRGQRRLLQYVSELVEDMSEAAGSQWAQLDKIFRSQDLMVMLTEDVFKGLIIAYKEHFLMEEFIRA